MCGILFLVEIEQNLINRTNNQIYITFTVILNSRLNVKKIEHKSILMKAF